MTPRGQSSNWNPTLDGLRGLAILLVMPFHFARTFQTQGAADRGLTSLAATGYLGVDLFFVLSGFLITGILLDARGSAGYFPRFYARRALRIFPLYYCLLALVVLVAREIPALAATPAVQLTYAHQGWFWTHTVNWLVAKSGSFGIVAPETDVVWSLSIEMQFYLVWPVLVLLLDKRRLPLLCGVLVAASVGLRAWLLAHGASPVTVYTATFTHFDALGLGAALACLIRSNPASPLLRLVRRSWWLVPLAFDLAIVAGAAGRGAGPALTAVFLCAAVGWAGVLLVTLGATPTAIWARLVRNRLLRRFGLYSYGLYLLHPWVEGAMPALGLSADRLSRAAGGSFAGHVLYLVLALTISTMAAGASYHLLEARFLTLKRRVPMPVGPTGR